MNNYKVLIHDIVIDINEEKFKKSLQKRFFSKLGLQKNIEISISKKSESVIKAFNRFGCPNLYVVGYSWDIYSFNENEIKLAIADIRYCKKYYSQVKVIAWQESENKERFMNAGADKFVEKIPDNLDNLIEAIKKYI